MSRRCGGRSNVPTVKPRGSVKPPVPTEDAEQAALFRMAALHEKTYPALALMFSIPNGSYKSPAAQRVFKATGLKSGVPDVFLPAPRVLMIGGLPFHSAGLFLELKRTTGGVVSSAQAEWIAALTRAGYQAGVFKGWEAAWVAIVDYLEGNPL